MKLILTSFLRPRFVPTAGRTLAVALLLSSFVFRHSAFAAEGKLNVLLIISDDLNNRVGCYGDALAKTPNIDALAASGRLFERAYCQFPHCNPSRSSFLSGRRPDVTRVTNNDDDLFQNLPGVMTLPHLFREHGYTTARFGKVFHFGTRAEKNMNDPQAWETDNTYITFDDEKPFPPGRTSAVKVPVSSGHGIWWRETLGKEGDLLDERFTASAVEWLEKRDATKPFFLAVGLIRPHVPLVAPAKFYDLYPLESITLPDAPADDEADIPAPARNGAVPGYANTCTPEQRRAAIRAYLACTSFVDAQAGRVLDALARLGLAENTIVVFTSDHGWHLGEHGLWHKRSLFEECARVPFIVRVPGLKAAGRPSASLVELLDIFPTLCDLCGVPAPGALDGKSLRPLLDDPHATVRDAAFTQARRGADAEYFGRSVCTTRWRCTEWNEGRDGLELYDHDADPHEYTNLAADPRHAATLKELRALLDGHFARLETTSPPAK